MRVGVRGSLLAHHQIGIIGATVNPDRAHTIKTLQAAVCNQFGVRLCDCSLFLLFHARADHHESIYYNEYIVGKI